MKNIEKLIKEYGKLCLIPVSELIKALEKDFINIENLQIACVPQDKLTRNFAKETTQCLFLVKKEDVDSDSQDGIVVSLQIRDDGFFWITRRTSFKSFPVWSSDKWTQPKKFIDILKESNQFLKDAKVSCDSHDRSSSYFIRLSGIST